MNKTKFITMRADEHVREIVDNRAKETGLKQADVIAQIIREWSEMKKQYVTVPLAKISIEEELARR
jgi:hypothetical protein